MENQKVNLVDYIHPKMDILFLALNAPEDSNKNAHWFTHNLSFWNLLYDSGLITNRIIDKLEGDATVFGSTSINYKNWVYGVTDLDKETVETDSTNIQTSTDQVKRILQILDNNEVKKLCIMHSKVTSAFQLQSLINGGYGLVGKYKNTAIFNVPFHNASVPNKPHYYSLLIHNSKTDERVEASVIVSQVAKELLAEEVEILTSKAPVLSGPKFTVPDVGNSITDSDIRANHIRITIDLKRYFPRQNQKITIQWKNEKFSCSYTIKDGKSNILSLGRDLVNRAEIKPGGLLRFQKIGNDSYIMDKIR